MSAPNTTPKTPWGSAAYGRILVLLGLVVGAVLRVRQALGDVSQHPDEFFQYLEPAHWHWTGEGIRAWEYIDGLRNWFMPAYHGAWMAALDGFGIHDGGVQHRFFLVHWALAGLSAAVYARRAAPAILRGATNVPAESVTQTFAGPLAAILVATWPALVWWAPHVLTELPSLFLLVIAFTKTSELLERPRAAADGPGTGLAIGLLVGVSLVLRIPNGPVAFLPLLAMFVHRRFRALATACLGLLPPIFALGLLDRLTWGDWFHSIVKYVEFNFVKGGAANFGTLPVAHYFEVLYGELGLVGCIVLPLLALVVWRRSWFWVLGALLVVSYLSTQPHKEERFILLFWPLLLIPAAAGFGAILLAVRRQVANGRGLPRFVAAVALLGLIGATFVTDQVDMQSDHMEMTCHDSFDVMDGLSYVGRQPDALGVLSDINWVCNGGTFRLGKNIPLDDYHAVRLSSPLYNYAVMRVETETIDRAGFQVVARFPRATVLRRDVPVPPLR
jgi:hypothetical protein